MKKITIAIDGLTGTGKGTTAKGVAKILGYTYLDTGAMYRCATLYAIQNNVLDADNDTKAKIIEKLDIDFRYENHERQTYLDGVNVESKIRNTDLALQMKPIVSCIPLREKMIVLQQSFGENGGIVCDARDAGTHIFPDAELKIFMTCDIDVRVDRRVLQLQEQGLPADANKIKRETLLRDETDYLGPNAVNKRADDAIILDTSNISIQEQIDFVVHKANEIISQ